MRRYTASLLLFALFLSACTAPASNRAEPPAGSHRLHLRRRR
ncbi:hypothetical protein [Caldilinea sp.]|nr:hypothetical protein [Caldilinea sp.]